LLLVEPRHNLVGHNLTVSVPILAILHLAVVIITLLAINKKSSEINKVEIGNNGIETRRKAPSKTHHEITKVVDMTRNTPPTRSHQTTTSSGLNVLQMRDFRIIGVIAESVLLAVGCTEDVHTSNLQKNNQDANPPRKTSIIVHEVTSLKGVVHRNPSKITETQHEAEAVSGDVHSGENSRFRPVRVDNIVEMEDADKNHGRRNEAMKLVLLCSHREVHDSPQNETRTQLADILEIQEAETRIQSATHPEIEEDVSRIAGVGKSLERILITRGFRARDGKDRVNIQDHREAECEDDRGSQKVNEVVVGIGRRQEARDDQTGKSKSGNDEAAKSVDAIAETSLLLVLELSTLDDGTGDNEVKQPLVKNPCGVHKEDLGIPNRGHEGTQTVSKRVVLENEEFGVKRVERNDLLSIASEIQEVANKRETNRHHHCTQRTTEFIRFCVSTIRILGCLCQKLQDRLEGDNANNDRN